jgi:hypothetical protein
MSEPSRLVSICPVVAWPTCQLDRYCNTARIIRTAASPITDPYQRAPCNPVNVMVKGNEETEENSFGYLIIKLVAFRKLVSN